MFAKNVINNFIKNSKLRSHKRNVHSTDRPFVCNQINCNKTFKTKEHLTQHKSTHSSDKIFGCDKCDQRFKTYLDLSNHKKFFHSNIRPFVCPRSDCNRSFKRREHLTRHKLIHSFDKPFECEECNKSFKYESLLKSHKMDSFGCKAIQM